jgi:DNA-binding response OmpR family regulator
MPNPDLAGRRVLVVEDDFLLGADIAEEIMSHNGIVVGPAMTLDAGAEMLRAEQPDACILNIRVGQEMIYGLADEVRLANIPFVFASGERRDSIPDRFSDIPLHPKPINMVKVAATLIGYQD